MEIFDRDFKGVWIPREIWLNTELTLLEKCIFTEIDSLDNEDNCIAGNDYFAEFCDCSESKISKSIKKLQDLGLIEVIAFDGRHRKIRVVKNTRQSSKKYYSASEKVQANNIYNNTSNKKINNTNTGIIQKQKDNKIQDKGSRVKNFVDAYHANCPNLPKVRRITDKRKQAISTINRKYSTEEILTVFNNANSSSFLTGNNDRGWKADIDFILREDKFVSILEGKYNDRKYSSRSKLHETGAKHVESFNKEDEKHLREFQSKLRKEGKRIVF